MLTIVSICLTIYAAKRSGTMAHFGVVPLSQRISNAAISYVIYLKKMFWPTDLAVFYPLRELFINQVLPAALLLLVVTGICVLYYKKHPYLFVGWLWYVGTMIPVIGIVQVGSQSMADRYAYVTFIGLFIGLVWLLADQMKTRIPNVFACISMVIILAGLSIITFYQAGFWKNSFVLFERALNVTEKNFLAHVGMGNDLVKQGKIEEGIKHFVASININPQNSANYMALGGLGYAYSLKGKHQDAVKAFKQALAVNPKLDEAHYRIGIELSRLGQLDEAIAAYQTAIELYPENPLYHSGLGNTYLVQGNVDQAIKEFQTVLSIEPANVIAHNNLGMLYMNQRRTEEAMKHFQKAIKIQPKFANAHYRLSLLLRREGRLEEARYHYDEAVKISPQYGEKVKR